jgi:hypothetical protein
LYNTTKPVIGSSATSSISPSPRGQWGRRGLIAITAVILDLAFFASFIVLVVMGGIFLFFLPIFNRFAAMVFFLLLERLWARLLLMRFFVLSLSLIRPTFVFTYGLTFPIFIIVMGNIAVIPMPTNPMGCNAILVWFVLSLTV